MDCNLYAVPGPYRQCPDCEGGVDGFSWDEHRALLTQHWPEPELTRPATPKRSSPAAARNATRAARPAPVTRLIPKAADEVTYHPRVSVTP